MIKDKFKEKYTEIQSIHGQNGNYNFDRYMLGLYNGMEMIIAMYENREPNYRSAHKIKFLNDKQDILQQRIDKAIEYIKEHLYMESTDGIQHPTFYGKMKSDTDGLKLLSILQGDEEEDNE